MSLKERLKSAEKKKLGHEKIQNVTGTCYYQGQIDLLKKLIKEEKQEKP